MLGFRGRQNIFHDKSPPRPSHNSCNGNFCWFPKNKSLNLLEEPMNLPFLCTFRFLSLILNSCENVPWHFLLQWEWRPKEAVKISSPPASYLIWDFSTLVALHLRQGTQGNTISNHYNIIVIWQWPWTLSLPPSASSSASASASASASVWWVFWGQGKLATPYIFER